MNKPGTLAQLSTSVCRLGSVDPRPSYHSRTQLWPVGYQATWHDAAAGTFRCDILDGGEEGPFFAVSLVLPHGDQHLQVRRLTAVHV